MLKPRCIWRDLALLTLLCAIVYGVGLTARGLSNWQESQRAAVAREMQARGEWLVPTLDGEAYLAKPPMMYWCQLALAEIAGRRTGEAELRLTVAVAGWLGVVALYLVARGLLRGDAERSGPHWHEHAAWWAALFLATGPLYVRSARTGELDALLVPFTVLAVGMIARAWRSHAERRRTDFLAVGLAVLAAVGAALTKGPPPLATIALAGYGAIALHAASVGGRPRTPVLLAAAAAGQAVAFAVALVRAEPMDAGQWAGVVLHGAGIGFVLALVAALARPAAARECFVAFSRTHPVGVVGVPLLVVWGWLWLVGQRIGADVVVAAVDAEVEDNLRLLVAKAPLRNLGAASYGIALGSFAAIAGAVWLAVERPRVGRAWLVPLAWAGLPIIALSLAGKGVGRYLTPVWPGIALLGAIWFASLLRDAKRPRAIAGGAYAAAAALAAAQAWWYVAGPEVTGLGTSPREFVRELARPESGVDLTRLGMLEFDNPAVDFYADAPVESFLDEWRENMPPRVGPRTLEDLRAQLAAEGGWYTLLIRDTQPEGQDPRPALERLAARGFEVREAPTESGFLIDHKASRVRAVRVRVP